MLFLYGMLVSNSAHKKLFQCHSDVKIKKDVQVGECK